MISICVDREVMVFRQINLKPAGAMKKQKKKKRNVNFSLFISFFFSEENTGQVISIQISTLKQANKFNFI